MGIRPLRILVLSLAVACHAPAFGDVRVLVSLPLSDAPAALGAASCEVILPGGEERTAYPESFLPLPGGGTLVLDTARGRLVRAEGETILGTTDFAPRLRAGERAQDVALLPDGTLAVLLAGSNELLFLPGGRRETTKTAYAWRLAIVDGRPVAEDAFREPAPGAGQPGLNDESSAANDHAGSDIAGAKGAPFGIAQAADEAFPPPAGLGASDRPLVALPLGADAEGNAYFKVLFGPAEDKLDLAYVYRLAPDGAYAGRVRVPACPNMPVARTLRIGPRGEIDAATARAGRYVVERYTIDEF